MIKALKINGSVKRSTSSENALVINHEEALRVLLAAEVTAEFSDAVREEMPAIITHWLQSPEDSPILLDLSYTEKWSAVLRAYCETQGYTPAPSKRRPSKSAKPVHIDFSDIAFEPRAKADFKFIDLFAGIGGFRIGLERNGGKCVFSSEWDKHAKQTYFQNYGEIPFGDITNFTNTGPQYVAEADAIPDHDILCGGFPCQPFSQAGLQRGFEDARGTLFFDILTIAKAKRPKVLFLENVKRLKGHDKGKTFQVICNSLRELGYKVYAKVIRAYDHGVPQNRERIFIVAFSEPLHFEFPKESRYSLYKNVGEILERSPDPNFTISDRMWEGHQRRLREHREKGNGFGYSLFNHKDEYVNTISARYWKDGSEILIDQKGQNPRVLTPRECARIQGYPEEFRPNRSKRYAYQQFGNSVAVPVIEQIAGRIALSLRKGIYSKETLDTLEPIVL